VGSVFYTDTTRTPTRGLRERQKFVIELELLISIVVKARLLPTFPDTHHLREKKRGKKDIRGWRLRYIL
jgi:hypothetical protein